MASRGDTGDHHGGSSTSSGSEDEERLVSWLLQQGLWPMDDMVAQQARLRDEEEDASNRNQSDAAYLQERVFPTLVPALHDLAELVQRQQELGVDSRASTRCVSRTHPTGASGPVKWLAQYLYRHNTAQTDALARHPYVVLSNKAAAVAAASPSNQ